MVRSLPWLNKASSAGNRTTRAPQTKRRRLEQEDSDIVPAQESRQNDGRRVRQVRTPSSSPPPAAVQPDEEYMRDGLSRDDAWIMVEDEFLETAKLYTVHLHQAEYQRLKDLARSQRVNLIRDISRPVDARSAASMETRKQREAKSAARVKDDAVRRATSVLSLGNRKKPDEDDVDDTPWMRDPTLSKLMARPPETSKFLARTTGARSNTRAAAGFSKARDERGKRSNKGDSRGAGIRNRNTMEGLAREINLAETTYDEDDLDAPTSLFRPRNLNVKKSPPLSSASKEFLHPSNFMKSKHSTVETENFGTARDLDVVLKNPREESRFVEKRERKKAEKAKKDIENKRRSIALDEIPTFLI